MLNSAECSPTKENSNQSVCEIVDSHLKYLDKFKLSFNDKYKYLPRIYTILKLYKNPYKFRFIAVSRFCSAKNVGFTNKRITEGTGILVQLLWSDRNYIGIH